MESGLELAGERPCDTEPVEIEQSVARAFDNLRRAIENPIKPMGVGGWAVGEAIREFGAIPTRLHADPAKPDWHRFWSRHTLVFVNGVRRDDVIFADTLTGEIVTFGPPTPEGSTGRMNYEWVAASIVFVPDGEGMAAGRPPYLSGWPR